MPTKFLNSCFLSDCYRTLNVSDELRKCLRTNTCRAAEEVCNKCDCDIRDCSKKISKLEGSFEETLEQLQKASVSLEEKNVMFKDKEEVTIAVCCFLNLGAQELSALSRRIQLLEGEAGNADNKLAKTTMDLATESKRADKIIKLMNSLNSRAMSSEVRPSQWTTYL